MNPAVTDLALFDVVPVVRGVAADCSHVDSPATTAGYTKDDDGLKHALTGADLVIIPAGVPRKVCLPLFRPSALTLAVLGSCGESLSAPSDPRVEPRLATACAP